MALDKIMIGERIRSIRELEFEKEVRAVFAERCGLTESHIGQIERGEILISLSALDKIVCSTGTKAQYILYGKKDDRISMARRNIDTLLDLCTPEELTYFLKCISAFKNYKKSK